MSRWGLRLDERVRRNCGVSWALGAAHPEVSSAKVAFFPLPALQRCGCVESLLTMAWVSGEALAPYALINSPWT